jgi:hypothetical protein
MVQSVKSNLQLFFAVMSLTAMMLVTLGNSPPLDHEFRFIPLIEKLEPQRCMADFKRDVSKAWSLTQIVESNKNINCDKRTAVLTENNRAPN